MSAKARYLACVSYPRKILQLNPNEWQSDLSVIEEGNVCKSVADQRIGWPALVLPRLSRPTWLALLTSLVLVGWLSLSSRGSTEVALPVPVQVPVPTSVLYGDEFGAALAIDGDFVAVGAARTNIGNNKEQGLLYLYKRDSANPDNFVLLKSFSGSDSTQFDNFGAAVALAGDTLVVGSIYASPDGQTNQGAAYVFQRNQGGSDNWGEVKKLLRGDQQHLVNFGSTVAIHGDTIVVGSPTLYGRAFIYQRNQGGTDNWGQTQILGNDFSDQNDRFGDAIVFDGETLVIGAPLGDLTSLDLPPNTHWPLFNNAGSVFVYKLENNQWTRKAKLFHSDINLEDKSSFQINYGAALAMNGNLLFVGASTGNVNAVATGKVFVYQLGAGTESPWGEPGGWGEVAQLSASDGAAFDHFGQALYAAGNGVFVTSPHKGLTGKVYFYHNPTGLNAASLAPAQSQDWVSVYSFFPPGDVMDSWFGDPIVSSGNNLLIGARARNNVYSYPLDAMLASDPNATATPTSVPATPTSGASAIYLPIVADQSGGSIPSTTAVLGNDQLLTGVGGVKFGAISNTLSASLAITIATSGAPTQELPSGVLALGTYLRISGAHDVVTDLHSPFVIGVPVPAGADPTHLALGYLNTDGNPLDGDDGEPFWNFLDGLYDASSGMFLTDVPYLAQSGTTFVLSQHPDFASPANGVPIDGGVVQSAGSKVGEFTVECKFFGTVEECSPQTEEQVATYLDQIYHRMANDFSYTNWPRLRNTLGTIVLKDKPSLAFLDGYATVIVPQTHYFKCKDAGGYYESSSGLLALCYDPAHNGINEYDVHVLIHEYFHSLQYTYPKVLQDTYTVEVPAGPLGGPPAVFKGKPWVIEGMAESVMNSYFEDDTMLRMTPRPLQKVDTFLGTGSWGDKIYNEYDAQDFWIYMAQHHKLNLGYLGGILEKGGASTFGVANALSTEFATPFADLYWGWVRNQIFEKTNSLGGGLGTACELNTGALLNGQPKKFTYSELSIRYPITATYETVPALTTSVVEVIFPHTKQGAYIQVGYKECGNLSDPAEQQACVVETQKLVHARIYQQDESNCSAEVLPGMVEPYEGARVVGPGAGKRFFVVVANGDTEKEHDFSIFIE